MPLSSVARPLAANLQRVAVGFGVLLGLQIRPEMLQRGHVDRGKLVVAQTQTLAGLSGQEGDGSALHLDGGTAELPDREAVENRRLPGVVTPCDQRDARLQFERLVCELLEAMEGNARDHSW